MTDPAVTIRVITRPGTNASSIGESHAWDGTSWRNATDKCDADGCGRLFIDCDTEETAEYLRGQLENDDRVESF